MGKISKESERKDQVKARVLRPVCCREGSMKYTNSLRESLKRDFAEYADLPENEVLAYYEKGSRPELDFSVLIFEKNGRPHIVTTRHKAVNISFSLSSCYELIDSFIKEVESLKRLKESSISE
ncbi:MAG: hypothetical protein LBB47_02385 [Spirochaetaceae bacterium]|jgi:hypothetical protein|nr:hypothetical protein [Spirochaetaceae bacterium]